MYQQTGQIEKALEYQQAHPTEIRLGKLYQNAERLLGKVNAQIRNVQARDLEGEEKRQRLDQLYEVHNRIAKFIEERGREIQEQAQQPSPGRVGAPIVPRSFRSRRRTPISKLPIGLDPCRVPFWGHRLLHH
jgi:hypothetical protein